MHRPALPARHAPIFRLLPARCRRGWACARGRPDRGSPRPQSACTRAVCGTLCKQDQARMAGPPLPLPTPCIAPCTAHQPTRRHGGGSFLSAGSSWPAPCSTAARGQARASAVHGTGGRASRARARARARAAVLAGGGVAKRRAFAAHGSLRAPCAATHCRPRQPGISVRAASAGC